MALGWRLAAATPPRSDATLKLPEDQCTLTKDAYRPCRVWVNSGNDDDADVNYDDAINEDADIEG